MRMSISTTSGFSRRASSTASTPSAASPMTSRSSSASRIILKPARTSAWSSAIRTRTVLMPRPRGQRRLLLALEREHARHLEAAAAPAPGVQLAAVHRDALAHADEAVAAAAEPRVRARPLPRSAIRTSTASAR